jgi:hypothetical protein
MIKKIRGSGVWLNIVHMVCEDQQIGIKIFFWWIFNQTIGILGLKLKKLEQMIWFSRVYLIVWNSF